MMKYLVLFLSCSSLLLLSGCEVGGEEEGVPAGAIGVNGTLTQLGKAATEAECPNGGVTLEHGIDQNEDGQLDSDEILKTYVLCHGQNGTDGANGNDGSDADVTALQAELDALKAVVATNTAATEINTAKVGYTDDLVTANAAVSANTVGLVTANAAVSINTAGLVTANAAVSTNTAGLVTVNAAVSTNTAANAAQDALIGLNTAKASITQAQADAITANTDDLLDIGSNAVFNGWDKSIVDDFDGAYGSLTGAPTVITQAQATAIAANTAKETFPGFGTSAGTALEGNFAETDPVFIAHAANTISTGDITNWDTSFGWGDHSGAVAANGAAITALDFTPFACAAGYAGAGCVYSDAVNCTGHGTAAADGTCSCDSGWIGSDCSEEEQLTGMVDNGDGTVTNHDLGIMWMKCAQGMTFENDTCTGSNSKFQYCDANDNSCNGGVSGNLLDGNGNSEAWDTCNDLVYAGYDDWRVPNKEELRSLIYCSNGHVVTGDYPESSTRCSDGDGAFDTPTIDTALFPNFPNSSFWTSASYPGGSDLALLVPFGYGLVSGSNKAGTRSVFCVR